MIHAYDDDRSEEAFQGISKHSLPRIKRWLLDLSERWCGPHCCIGVLFRGVFVETLATSGEAASMYWLTSSYTIPSAFLIHTAGSGIHPPNTSPRPGGKRRKRRLLFLRQWYHDFEIWKFGKTRLERKPLQHGLIFHPWVPSAKVAPTKIAHDFARCSSKFARYNFESRSLAPSFRLRSAGCKPIRMSWTLHVPQWIFG